MVRQVICAFFLLLVTVVNASIIDELATLEAYKFNNTAAQQVQPSKQEQPRRTQSAEKRYITLSTGKRMDISDWQIVHFMSSTCKYCQQFNPTLKQISDSTKIPVFTYSFDGKGDESFPNVFPTNQEILNEFFAELPRATPTDFLINVNTMETLPLSQGAVSYQAFLQRLDEVFIYVDRNLRGK